MVPISAGVYFGAVMLYVRNLFNQGAFPLSLVDPATAGLWGGLGVSVWLIDVRRPRTWRLVPFVAVVGGLATGVTPLFNDAVRPSFPFGLDWLSDLIAMNLMFSPFQTCVAMALGVRLWWETPPATESAP
ncbi:MAG TPA: hypothetical protein VM165_03625 [Planctomycetaceae bacterium]|nr:hypothetical protein [Planctomycetaceae bacterium]